MIDSIHYRLGDSTLSITRWKYAINQPFQLIQLHHNEETAEVEAKHFSTAYGVEFLSLLNNHQRYVSFSLSDTLFRFDPNRMFSEAGATASLKQDNHPFSDTALQTVLRFGEAVLRLTDTTKTIVAVHNNTNGRFSILYYTADGISLVHHNLQQDVDDFFLTNDEELFEALRDADFNVVLENAERMADDGSMSILFGKRKWRYVNVEAEHGHGPQQQRMLQALKRILID